MKLVCVKFLSFWGLYEHTYMIWDEICYRETLRQNLLNIRFFMFFVLSESQTYHLKLFWIEVVICSCLMVLPVFPSSNRNIAIKVLFPQSSSGLSRQLFLWFLYCSFVKDSHIISQSNHSQAFSIDERLKFSDFFFYLFFFTVRETFYYINGWFKKNLLINLTVWKQTKISWREFSEWMSMFR